VAECRIGLFCNTMKGMHRILEPQRSLKQFDLKDHVLCVLKMDLPTQKFFEFAIR
jgi:hypothetical protein